MASSHSRDAAPADSTPEELAPDYMEMALDDDIAQDSGKL
jgi:hypothetical protein